MTTARPITHPQARPQPSVPAHPGLTGGPVYLDYNATTPIDPRVTEAMRPALIEVFGNPSSAHSYGPPAAAALDRARAQVAALIGADDPTGPHRDPRGGSGAGGRIVFTGSGSEADALAIRGSVLAALDAPARWTAVRRPQVITQATEHPAVLAVCRYLAHWHDVEVTILRVDGTGLLDPADLAAALTDRTVLVTVMHANNETGTCNLSPNSPPSPTPTACCSTPTPPRPPARSRSTTGRTSTAHPGRAKMYAPGHRRLTSATLLEPVVGGRQGGPARDRELPHILAPGAAADLAAADLAAEPDRLATCATASTTP
jgi:cysteine desulfurase